ncbi:CPCC family cysteine-rich protein [Aquirhabdus parva]|uniref:CPCC family cysteine-rich protein n=1 Tax=Aquirhabdus parva TaxID=2283318 RepID=UPI0013B45EF7|nr:CPCC family cysteine-rich protein [Aquirhabdus parva]
MLNACPCCGHFVFVNYGSYDICPICFWEDDWTQLQYPFTDGGTNQVSLAVAQINYVQFAACRFDLIKNVRIPLGNEYLDDRWFPLWAKAIKWKGFEIDHEQSSLEPDVSPQFIPYWLNN